MKKQLIALIFICFLSQSIYAQESSVTFTITPNITTIGSPIQFNINVETAFNTEILGPPAISGDPFYVINFKHSKQKKENTTIHIFNNTFTTFQTGVVHTPTFNIKTKHQNQVKTIQILPQTIRIQPLLTSTQNLTIKDIHPPLKTTINKKKYVYIFIIAIALLIALIIIIRILINKLRKTPTETIAPKIILSPYEKAVKALQKVHTEKLYQKGKFKEHYISLVEILKEYLSKTFHAHILEMTTSECLEACKSLTDEQTLVRIKKLLTLSDQIKFAKHIPSGENNENSTKITLDIINRINTTEKGVAETS